MMVDIFFQISRSARTLNSYMNVVFGLLRLPDIFVGFGEGICERGMSALFEHRNYIEVTR